MSDPGVSPAAAARSGPQPGGTSGCVARLVPLEPGVYAFTLAAETGWRDPVAGLALPAVHVAAPPQHEGAVEITDDSGRSGCWLGGRHRMLFVKTPAAGGAALVTAHLAREPEAPPVIVEVRRLGPNGKAGDKAHLPLLTLQLDDPHRLLQPPAPPSIEVVAHIRGRGDLHFVDSPWIGRVGAGAWIEAFTIVPRNPAMAAAIEYKGLTGSGAETPWLACGSACGTRGRSTPLVGFAVRQKAATGGARFDCEYSGYFQSGTTAGPARNGAPCRSPRDNDPLEGLQLRITPRPPAGTAASF